jgi:hypothetical protein
MAAPTQTEKTMNQEQRKLSQAEQDLEFLKKKLAMADTEENKTRWTNLIKLKELDIARLKGWKQ